MWEQIIYLVMDNQKDKVNDNVNKVAVSSILSRNDKSNDLVHQLIFL